MSAATTEDLILERLLVQIENRSKMLYDLGAAKMRAGLDSSRIRPGVEEGESLINCATDIELAVARLRDQLR